MKIGSWELLAKDIRLLKDVQHFLWAPLIIIVTITVALLQVSPGSFSRLTCILATVAFFCLTRILDARSN